MAKYSDLSPLPSSFVQSKHKNDSLPQGKNFICDVIRKNLINTGDLEKDIDTAVSSIQDLRLRPQREAEEKNEARQAKRDETMEKKRKQNKTK